MRHQTFPRLSAMQILVAGILLVLLLPGCSAIPFLSSSTPVPPNTLVYDAPVSLTIKNGELLPGTTIAYGGKLPTGAAKVLITGLLAPKQVADTLDWQGSPAPNVNVKLAMRVASFDDDAITLVNPLVGAAHVEISNVTIQPGGTAGTVLMEFSAPVMYSLGKNEMISGSKVVFAGSSPNGAQFLGVDGYPYRKQGDSLQYVGRLTPKVFLLLDLRVISYSDTGAVVGGKAEIKIEQ
jgi:hypothetical protein